MKTNIRSETIMYFGIILAAFVITSAFAHAQTEQYPKTKVISAPILQSATISPTNPDYNLSVPYVVVFSAPTAAYIPKLKITSTFIDVNVSAPATIDDTVVQAIKNFGYGLGYNVTKVLIPKYTSYNT